MKDVFYLVLFKQDEVKELMYLKMPFLSMKHPNIVQPRTDCQALFVCTNKKSENLQLT